MSQENSQKSKDLIIGSLFATNNDQRYNMIKIDPKVYDLLSNLEIGGRLVVHFYKDAGERKRTDAIGHVAYQTKEQVDSARAFYMKNNSATDSDADSVKI